MDLDISHGMFAISGAVNFRAVLHALTLEEREAKARERRERHERHEAKKAADEAEHRAAEERKKLAKLHRRQELRRRQKEANHYITTAARLIAPGFGWVSNLLMPHERRTHAVT